MYDTDLMAGGAAAMGGGMIVFYLIVMVVMLVSGWKIYAKAGKPGWAVIVPIYNIIVMLEIVKKPVWWIILLLIPVVNVVVMIMVMYNLVLCFGKPGWHVLLILFFSLIYYPYLAFSSATYQG